MNKTTEKAAEWWNDPQSQPSGGWVEVPSVGENMNRRASDDPAIDWLNHSAIFLSNQPKPVKALSVGCGFGIIERVLRQRDICQTIDGLDVAEKAIQRARQKAEEEGLKGLSYHVADLNTVSLPEETYDVVYAHAALHHVFQLEHLLDQIKKTLKSDGIFIVHEYIGPAQMQFPQQHLQLADAFLKSIPERYRQMRRGGGIKHEALRLSVEKMNSSDPSEGIRASEIVPLIASRFEIRHFRYVGGTLLLLIFNEIAGNFNENDAESMRFVDALISLDNFLLDSGVLPSYHVYMACKKTDNPMPMQTRNVLPPAASVFRTQDLQALTVAPRPLGLIAAEPNPFRADSQGEGRTTVSWLTYATNSVQVHVDAPDGPLFARSGPGIFSQETGQWVRDGTKLYLQNVSRGLDLTAENTIAVITLRQQE